MSKENNLSTIKCFLPLSFSTPVFLHNNRKLNHNHNPLVVIHNEMSISRLEKENNHSTNIRKWFCRKTIVDCLPYKQVFSSLITKN